MIERFITNPLLLREFRLSVKPTIRSLIMLGISIGLVLTIFCFILTTIATETGFIQLTISVFALLIISVPPFLAYAAVIVFARDISNGYFETLFLTTISNIRLIEGYILSTLYRCRGLLAILAGFTPFAVIGVVFTTTYRTYESCSPYPQNSPLACQPSSIAIYIMSQLAIYTSIAVGVWGFGLFSTTLGILLAASRRYFAIFRLIALLLVTATLLGVVVWLIRVPERDLPLHSLLFAIVFYLLTILLIWLFRARIRMPFTN